MTGILVIVGMVLLLSAVSRAEAAGRAEIDETPGKARRVGLSPGGRQRLSGDASGVFMAAAERRRELRTSVRCRQCLRGCGLRGDKHHFQRPLSASYVVARPLVLAIPL